MENFMRFVLTTIVAVLAGLFFMSTSAAAEESPELNCNQGPVQKTYGKTAWLVYACNDSRSVVIVSNKGNPALPFFFMLYVKANGDLQLHGEGTGNKTATEAAYKEIEALTQTDIASLVKQAGSLKATGSIK
jgi:hypothetical protein